VELGVKRSKVFAKEKKSLEKREPYFFFLKEREVLGDPPQLSVVADPRQRELPNQIKARWGKPNRVQIKKWSAVPRQPQLGTGTLY